MISIEMPRLLSEYFAACTQSTVRNSADVDVDVSSAKKTESAKIFMGRGRGGSPEPPDADVTTRMAGD